LHSFSLVRLVYLLPRFLISCIFVILLVYALAVHGFRTLYTLLHVVAFSFTHGCTASVFFHVSLVSRICTRFSCAPLHTALVRFRFTVHVTVAFSFTFRSGSFRRSRFTYFRVSRCVPKSSFLVHTTHTFTFIRFRCRSCVSFAHTIPSFVSFTLICVGSTFARISARVCYHIRLVRFTPRLTLRARTVCLVFSRTHVGCYLSRSTHARCAARLMHLFMVAWFTFRFMVLHFRTSHAVLLAVTHLYGL